MSNLFAAMLLLAGCATVAYGAVMIHPGLWIVVLGAGLIWVSRSLP
jgi:hypothetical protein